MGACQPIASAMAVLFVLASAGSAWSGQQAPNAPLPGSPTRLRGEAVFAAVEGWGATSDGQQNLIIVGYYNRNKDQALDIPVGPNNRIEPGGPDMGQPTHFEPGRHYGVFAITVPKDFGAKRLTWTLVANGQTTQVQLSVNPSYVVEYLKHTASGNTPPVVKHALDGQEFQGPPAGAQLSLTGAVGEPLALKIWARDTRATEGVPAGSGSVAPPAGRGGPPRGGAAPPASSSAPGRGAVGRGSANDFDLSAAKSASAAKLLAARPDGPAADVTITWRPHRMPPGANVTFSDGSARLFNKGDSNAWMDASTTATFSAAGEYWLRAQVNDA